MAVAAGKLDAIITRNLSTRTQVPSSQLSENDDVLQWVVDHVWQLGVGAVAQSVRGTLAWRVGVAAVVAFLLVTPTAVWLLQVSQRPVPPGELDFTAAVLAAVSGVAILPVASWIALRLIGINRAGRAVVSGWTAALVIVLLVQDLVAGGTKPAWVYGLCVGLGYALGSLATWSNTDSPR